MKSAVLTILVQILLQKSSITEDQFLLSFHQETHGYCYRPTQYDHRFYYEIRQRQSYNCTYSSLFGELLDENSCAMCSD